MTSYDVYDVTTSDENTCAIYEDTVLSAQYRCSHPIRQVLLYEPVITVYYFLRQFYVAVFRSAVGLYITFCFSADLNHSKVSKLRPG